MTNVSTTIADVIVPEIFTPYTQQLTMEKTAIIQSGIAARDDFLDNLLAGGGLTFTVPSWQDIGDPAENISSDDPNTDSTPNTTQTSGEVAVRLSRNASWSTMRLATALAGADPMQSIASRVSDYWVRRLQRAFVAAAQGVFATNELTDPTLGRSGKTGLQAAYGAQADLTNDISGSVYSSGATDFNAESFIDTCTLLGDAAEDVTAVFMHSIVYSKAQKNNLIDFIPDAEGHINIPTYLGRRVIVDDGMPNPAGDSSNGACRPLRGPTTRGSLARHRSGSALAPRWSRPKCSATRLVVTARVPTFCSIASSGRFIRSVMRGSVPRRFSRAARPTVSFRKRVPTFACSRSGSRSSWLGLSLASRLPTPVRIAACNR